jgi:hypothetical protein
MCNAREIGATDFFHESQFPDSRSFLPRDSSNSTLLALGPAFVKQPHLTCPSFTFSLGSTPPHSFPHTRSLVAPPTTYPQSLLTRTTHPHSQHEAQEAHRDHGSRVVWRCHGLNGHWHCALLRQRFHARHCCNQPVRIQLSLSLPLLPTRESSLPSHSTSTPCTEGANVHHPERQYHPHSSARAMDTLDTTNHYAASCRIARIRCHQATAKCHTHWTAPPKRLFLIESTPRPPSQHLQAGPWDQREKLRIDNDHPMPGAVVSLNQARS